MRSTPSGPPGPVPGLPPNRIDILTDLGGGETFAAAWQDRVEHELGEVVIPFLGRRSLIRSKRAAGRLKDLADIETLGERP